MVTVSWTNHVFGGGQNGSGQVVASSSIELGLFSLSEKSSSKFSVPFVTSQFADSYKWVSHTEKWNETSKRCETASICWFETLTADKTANWNLNVCGWEFNCEPPSKLICILCDVYRGCVFSMQSPQTLPQRQSASMHCHVLKRRVTAPPAASFNTVPELTHALRLRAHRDTPRSRSFKGKTAGVVVVVSLIVCLLVSPPEGERDRQTVDRSGDLCFLCL